MIPDPLSADILPNIITLIIIVVGVVIGYQIGRCDDKSKH